MIAGITSEIILGVQFFKNKVNIKTLEHFY